MFVWDSVGWCGLTAWVRVRVRVRVRVKNISLKGVRGRGGNNISFAA